MLSAIQIHIDVPDLLAKLCVVFGTYFILGLVIFIITHPPNWWKKAKAKVNAYRSTHRKAAEVIDYILFCIKTLVAIVVIGSFLALLIDSGC